MKNTVRVHSKSKRRSARSTKASIRSSKKPPAEVSPLATYIPASEAKNRFATVLDHVSKGQQVFILKHNAPKAVVISVEKFQELSAAADSMLNSLTAAFDARFARMQTAEARAATESALDASPDELGKAALNAARTKS